MAPGLNIPLTPVSREATRDAPCGRTRVFANTLSKSDNQAMETTPAPFDFQPILRGKLLQLRPLRPGDYHDLYAVASDPLIWEQHPAKDRCQENVFQEFFLKALESGGALVAIDRKDHQVIGSSRFHAYDAENNEVEIGWTFLARSHWGGVYNREMKELMLRHAFTFVDRVVFLIGPENLRSQKAVEKIGGVRMGSRRNAEGRDSFLYQITAAAFAETFGNQNETESPNIR